MSYVAIPSNIKNVQSVSLKVMSPEEMEEMSYGEVLTSETINYRTGTPQVNGLFCQAIFGPVKDWECACGKYKRYRYAGVICDKCGVEVTHSSVRRERMGHISLAVPCVHPWFLRVIPSRIALLLDMKASDISKVCYFSAYIITEINEAMREEYLSRIDQESEVRINSTKGEFDLKFQELSRQYQINKSSGKFNIDELRAKYEADKEILKQQQAEVITKIETIAEMAKKELSAIEVRDVINENIHQELAQKFGPVFKSGIGAEAIETLLRKIELERDYNDLKAKVASSKGQNKKALAKKMKIVKYFLQNNTRPEWMILHRVMVLPPDLRPMLQLDGGRFAASDLNELYRRLINRNNRLRKLIQIGAPEVILRNEKRMLQESVEALIDNSARNGKQVMASTGVKRPLKSLTDVLKGKQGRFRQNLLGKRVDYSGRSVIIIGPNLKLDQCGLPKQMALELFKPFLIGRILTKSEQGLLPEEYQCYNVYSARRLIESKKPIVYDILDEVIAGKFVLLNRAPTLHRLSFLAFKPVLVEGKAIQLHPLVCRAFNADFDGDQMAVHLPITIKGQEEARNLIAPSHNLIKPANGKLIMSGHNDVHLGVYYLTTIGRVPENYQVPAFSNTNEVFLAWEEGNIQINDLIRVKLKEREKSLETTMGRIIFNQCFPEDYPFFNEPLNKKSYEKLIDKVYHDLGQETLGGILDTIKNVTFKYATSSGITMTCSDLVSPEGKREQIAQTQEKVTKLQELFTYGLMTDEERYKQVVNLWRITSDNIAKTTEKSLDKHSNAGIIVSSGAKGNISQVNLMVGMRGLSVSASGQIIELPAIHGFAEGLTGLEYFIIMKGARKGQADLALKTADAGYLTRRLVDVAQNLVIMSEDCQTEEGILLTAENSKALGKNLLERAYGRYLLQDIVLEGETYAKKGELLDYATATKLKDQEINELMVRSVTRCNLPRGICQHCYGIDFSTHEPVALGTAVGIIGAQSLGEPSTQLTINSVKQLGGTVSAAASNITAGLPRVEEIFEGRTPKYIAPMSTIDGVVEKIEGNIDNGFKITVVQESQTLSLPYNSEENLLLTAEGKNISLGDPLMTSPSGEVILASFEGKLQLQGNELSIYSSEKKVEEHLTSSGIYLQVKVGQKVKKGQALADGPLDLQILLDTVGLDTVRAYIVQQLIGIYADNGIDIDEKHIEVIIRQMCSRVQVLDAGDSEFVTGDLIKITSVVKQNQELAAKGQKIATFKRVMTGISRAALTTDSFLSAASFQETARVLVQAAISQQTDWLTGLKENVILGQLIPCGTGFDEAKIKELETQVEEFDEVGEVVV